MGEKNLPLNGAFVHQSTGTIIQADGPFVKARELFPNSLNVEVAPLIDESHD